MHPRRSVQGVLLCDLCETVPLQSHCELCNINLCVNCAVKHVSDSSKRHKVVPFLHKKSTPNYPKCPDHADKHCEIYCEKCDVPVCSTCVTSGKHKGHDISDVLEKLGAKTESLQKDLEELETRIYPQYEKMVSNVQSEKAELETNYGKLTTAADQQGEAIHREITAIVNQRKSAITEMKTKHLDALNKNTEEITQKMAELKQIMSDLKLMLKSNDVSLTSTYKSRNSEFRTLPPTVRVTLPSFSPQKINKDQLNEMFGSLSPLSINTEHGDTMKSAEAVSSPPVKPLLDEPRLTATIDTGCNELYSVSRLSEDQVWTCGTNKTMKLLNLQSELLTSIQTKSGDAPGNIAVTRDGDLVYTDSSNNTVNLIKNKQIQTVITLQGWRPRFVCCTAANHLLVTMNSDDRKQSKVVRYSGSTEKQSIQFDDQGRPLYSSSVYSKYISENKNLDICVADWGARAVVVVNQSGNLRFRYTGHPSNTKQSFNPVGITTDSQSHILTADYHNHRIHILDQDGQFLRYIHCGLKFPWGLCVDIRDNLFVAEWGTAKSAEAVSSPPVKPLLDEPRLTATIDTGCNELYSVSRLSEDQVWTCGTNKTMKLLNLQSELLTSIQTKSGDAPGNIAVTRDGDLVYTDSSNNTVNLIKNKQIQTVITLQGWRPRFVCCTAANHLLVTMNSDDRKQSKVVRYSGSTEKQSIQFDDQGRPLYSSSVYSKYISENKNLDICVADWGARAVVVVNQSGNLRFRYTGHPSNTKQSFNPVGITTDSQSHILTADYHNHRIHILDQDGQFLRYIHCGLKFPWGLCVDIRDNLFVAEWGTAKVKKIQYL
ncbi:tripartite motif-containing protein 3-like [Ostrea edulis]|uniref:tripartite motif-containing protein 3-like n=1 Tax=Ostrea edulis TaxID=37623 RepID=UPI0024AFD2FB|nr:tripartite motif-containing protein 3-like [Ostrea edulis]